MALFRSLTRQFKALAVAQPALPGARPAIAAGARALTAHAAAASGASTNTILSRYTATSRLGQSFFPQVQIRSMGYKLKTKSAVKKRFRVNCNGLVKRNQANKRHLATKKTRERIRRLGKSVLVEGKIRKNILKMLHN